MSTPLPHEPSQLASWFRGFDHLSFRVKFVLMGLLFAVPWLIGSGWIAAQAQSDAHLARERDSALKCMRLVVSLLESVAQHRGLSARVLAGTEALSRDLVVQQSLMRGHARNLDQALAARAEQGLDPDSGLLLDEVEALSRLPHAKVPERNFDLHNELADRLLTISSRIEMRVLASLGTERIDEAHAYAAVFSELPQIAERIARQGGYGSGVLDMQTFMPTELVRYGLFAGHARLGLRQFLADRKTVAALSSLLALAGTRDSIEVALTDAEVFVEDSIATVMSFRRDELAGEQHFNEGAAAIKGVLRVSDALAEKLMQRAWAELEESERRLRGSLLWMLASVSLIAVLYIGFERSTVTRLKYLQRASQILADGKFDGRVAVNGSDEVAALGHALEQMRAQLNQAVQDSAQALAERQAESEHRAFFARWSHDLRTPLTAVLGYTQLLLSRTDPATDPPQRVPLLRIELAAQHLLQLVDDVLHVSTSAQAGVNLRLEPVDLGDLARDALDMIEPSARAAGIELKFESSAATAIASADRIRAMQVLSNLLSNAVKFNRPQGQILVSLRTVEERVELTIADQGQGLSSVDLAELFLPQQRLGAEQRGIPGHGLGLAIAKRLTQEMDGTIKAYSSPGQGTQFVWSLPCWEGETSSLPAAQRPPVSANSPIPLEAASAPSGGTKWQLRGRIVYIEDNEVNASLMQAMLRPFADISLSLLTSADEALAAPLEPRIDLWIVDRQVAGYDGIALLAPLRQRHGPLRAVMYSADGSEAAKVQALEAGFADYWVKPMPIADILDNVQKQLQSPPLAGPKVADSTEPRIAA